MKAKQTNVATTMQMEPARRIISPPSVSPGSTKVGHQKFRTLLELIHHQEFDLVIETNGAEVEKLIAPFDLVRWDELNLAQTTAQKAIVRADLFLDSELSTQLSIARETHDGNWNLFLTLMVDSSAEKCEKNLKRAQQVGYEVLNALHRDLKDRTSPLNFSALTKPEEDAVQAVASETLCQSGGHVWKKPLDVVIDDEIVLNLHGRMAAKPDPNYVAKEETLEGTCRGFVNDHRQRILFFRIGEGNCVEIYFTGDDVLKKTIDLVNIAELNRRVALCKVKTKQTTDTRAKSVYQFVSIETDEPKPDLLTRLGSEVIKNSDTATSATHSNLS